MLNDFARGAPCDDQLAYSVLPLLQFAYAPHYILSPYPLKVLAVGRTCTGKSRFVHAITDVLTAGNSLIPGNMAEGIASIFDVHGQGAGGQLEREGDPVAVLAQPVEVQSQIFNRASLSDLLFFKANPEPSPMPDSAGPGFVNLLSQIRWVFGNVSAGSPNIVRWAESAEEQLGNCLDFLLNRAPRLHDNGIRKQVEALAELNAVHLAVAKAEALPDTVEVIADHVDQAAKLVRLSEQNKPGF